MAPIKSLVRGSCVRIKGGAAIDTMMKAGGAHGVKVRTAAELLRQS